MTMTAWTTEATRVGEYANLNGLHMYYETHGEGRPMVLLHGGLYSGEMFGPVTPALAGHRKVIVPDLQGHGRTADIDRPIDIQLMADDIAALIRHLGLEQVDLVGYSLGGGVALFTASKYPELVRKLVVAGVSVRRDAIPPEMLAQQVKVNAAAAEFMKDTPMYELYARVAPRPEDFGRLLDKVGSSMAKDFDHSEVVRALKVPTLIVAAGRRHGATEPPCRGLQAPRRRAARRRLDGRGQAEGWPRPGDPARPDPLQPGRVPTLRRRGDCLPGRGARLAGRRSRRRPGRESRYPGPLRAALGPAHRGGPQAGAGDEQVLIRVRASTVSQTDTHLRGANPFVWRLILGLRRPRIRILGVEFAGEVEAVGAAVTEFKVGDRVFGGPRGFGAAHAEYICLRESAPITQMPAGMSFEDAAAVCDGSSEALATLRKAETREGQRLVIYGASGSLGTAAVQLAKHFGAHVTAVCNTKNVEIVRSLGADEVVDYTQEDFTKNGQKYDAIIDAVGKYAYYWGRRALKPGGIYVETDFGPHKLDTLVMVVLTRWFSTKRLRFGAGFRNKADLLFVKGLIEAAKSRPVIDRRYPFEQVAEAHAYVETWQKTGNVVLTVAAD